MIVAFVLQAICLFLVVAVGQTPAALFAFTLVLVYFTWGEIYSLFPATSGDYFGTQARHVELRACSTPPRAWPRSSAAGSARCCSSGRAAGRWASTAAR